MALVFSLPPFTAHAVDRNYQKTIELSNPALWEAMPAWLSNPSTNYVVTPIEGSGGLRFTVSSGGMKWRHILSESLDTGKAPYLTVRYRAEKISSIDSYFVYIGASSGGMSKYEAMPILLDDLECDGIIHEITVAVPQINVSVLAIQLLSEVCGAYIDIQEMSFSCTPPPKLKLTNLLNISKGWTAAEEFKPISFVPNASARDWLNSLRFEDAWFQHPEVMIEGIPFHVMVNDPNVQASSMHDDDAILVDINSTAGTVYLFGGAEFIGTQSPSLGSGLIRAVEEVDRFLIEIDYADGIKDLVFPIRLSSGKNEIVERPAIYVVRPTRLEVINTLAVIDKMQQGRFFLAGITIVPDMPRQADICVQDTNALNIATDVRKGSICSTSIGILVDEETMSLCSLINRHSQTEWLEVPSPIVEYVSDATVDTTLHTTIAKNGEIEISVRFVNKSAEPLALKPTFPVIRGLSPSTNGSELRYCFPQSGAIIGESPVRLRRQYGGLFPLQFVDVYHPEAGGIYVRTHDAGNNEKTFWLEKDTKIALGVDYPEQTIAPGETLALPTAVIGAHQGDWHDALDAYRRWVSTWYRPVVPRKEWFRKIFNFRQVFLHYNSAIGSNGVFDHTKSEYRFNEEINNSIAAFGKVDYIHVFDWGFDPQQGRVGDYKPWSYLGGLAHFREEILRLRGSGIPVGLYFEGYMLDSKSTVAKEHGQQWQLLNDKSEPYSSRSDRYYVCPHVEEWQAYLSRTVERVCKETTADGYYLDQFGFNYQYPCHNETHGHPVPSSQIQGEAEMLCRVRNALPAEKVLYTEETPTDVSSQYQDGSFTYAISRARKTFMPVALNLTRFALPDFKTFEIIICDRPLLDDYDAVKQVFFNGEGIWLEGPLSEPQWFTDGLCDLISKTHAILCEHSDAFGSDRPVPLVGTLNPFIFANKFPVENKTVWTLYNSSYSTVRGYLLEVEHSPEAIYYDLWNNMPIEGKNTGERRLLNIEIGPRDVGCVMKSS